MNYRIFPAFLACWFLSLNAGATAEPAVPVEPAPDWVVEVNPDIDAPVPHSEVAYGVYHLLTDRQTYVKDGDHPAYHVHYADTAVSRKGLEEVSQLNISFNPGYESVVLHGITVWRDGEPIDKLDTAKISRLQREEELENLIYNGLHTINIVLDDIRVGDTVETRFTRTGYNPVYQGLFGYGRSLNWSVPVGRLHIRLLWDGDTPLHHKLINDDGQVNRRKTASGYEYTIDREAVGALLLDGQTPSWYDPYAGVYFSELSSWREVAEWARPLFEDAVTRGEPVDRVIENIRRQHDSRGARIAAALRFVQGEIRYLGLEIGENSHQPHRADTTLERRYGDCKDKTVLLVTILRALGVEAYPALVHSDRQQTIDRMLPGAYAFDHVIVQVRTDVATYWLDPTRNYQRGALQDIYQPDYGYALVLEPGADALTPVQIDALNTRSELNERFDLTGGMDVAAGYRVRTLYTGLDAELQRHQLAGQGHKQVRKNYLDFYRSYYPQVEVVEPAEFSEGARPGSLQVEEAYRIDDLWEKAENGDYYEATFYANAVSAYLEEPEQVKRKDPLVIDHPVNIKQVIEVDLFERGWDIDSGEVVEDNPYFYFRSNTEFEKAARKLILTYEYRSKTDFVPADGMEAYAAGVEKAANNTAYSLYENRGAVQGGAFDAYLVWAIIVAYVLLFIAAVVLWRVDVRRHPFTGTMEYFPVSPYKLTAMWILTFGFYSIYWFYRNWKFVRERDRSSIMPVARGIFHPFWYYPLFAELFRDSQQRFDRRHLPSKPVGVVLALLFFIAIAGSRVGNYTWLWFLVALALLLPLANYIQFINKDNPAAIAYNSRWRLRHYFLVLISAPLFLLSFGSQVGLVAHDKVVEGDWLLGAHVKHLQRKGIIQPGDRIGHFYSDAFVNVRADGNGYTQRHVFSYWREGERLMYEAAEYADIKNLEVDWAQTVFDNTIVTIVRDDGSRFMLYVSNIGGKDKAFVSGLKTYWKQDSPE